MTTLKVSIYAGILIALPVLLYQAYAFLLPALKPTEKRVVLPFLILVPLLFIAGVVFSYFVVVPAATKFLLNFNNDQFNIQVRASEYYSFFIAHPDRARLGVPGADGDRGASPGSASSPRSSSRTIAATPT